MMRIIFIALLIVSAMNAQSVSCMKVSPELTICTDEDGVQTDIWTY